MRLKEFVPERIGTNASKRFCYAERTSLVSAADLSIPA